MYLEVHEIVTAMVCKNLFGRRKSNDTEFVDWVQYQIIDNIDSPVVAEFKR